MIAARVRRRTRRSAVLRTRRSRHRRVSRCSGSPGNAGGSSARQPRRFTASRMRDAPFFVAPICDLALLNRQFSSVRPAKHFFSVRPRGADPAPRRCSRHRQCCLTLGDTASRGYVLMSNAKRAHRLAMRPLDCVPAVLYRGVREQTSARRTSFHECSPASCFPS
jgi:hypothetical protein